MSHKGSGDILNKILIYLKYCLSQIEILDIAVIIPIVDTAAPNS
jgi:hypothetical protein